MDNNGKSIEAAVRTLCTDAWYNIVGIDIYSIILTNKQSEIQITTELLTVWILFFRECMQNMTGYIEKF